MMFGQLNNGRTPEQIVHLLGRRPRYIGMRRLIYRRGVLSSNSSRSHSSLVIAERRESNRFFIEPFSY